MIRILLVLCSSSLILVSSQQDHFTYTTFPASNPNITFTNNAQLLNPGVIELTSSNPKLVGQAFQTTPFQFKNSSNGTVFSFSTCFQVVSADPSSRGGDGFTFAIVPSRDFKTTYTVGGDLGLMCTKDNGNTSNHLFAVEFDTYRNGNLNDIDGNHVGIDINSLISNASAPASYVDLKLTSGQRILAWIEYDSATSLLNVTLSPSSTRPTVPLLSVPVDLSPVLLETMYVGFTASTGVLASSHYILGWSFSMNGAATSLYLESPGSLDSLGSLPRSTRRQNRRVVIIVSSTTILISLSILLCGAIYCLIVRRRNNVKQNLTPNINVTDGMEDEESTESWELDIWPTRYKYSELKQATKNFSDTEVIGKGGSGQVYKGTLSADKNRNIAVKRILNKSKHGFHEFLSEISTIGKLHHRNLVQLLGWCRHRAELFLVYEFMPNGSLDKLLFHQPKCVLSWQQRFRIIKGVASGMWYLHEGYEKVVIHRDVKSGNVLLDAEMNAKLGDFGLAKLHDHGSNLSTTRVVGTFGYMAPELLRTGRALTSSDVFSFGILLLEVVCGRRPIDSSAARPEDLALVDLVHRKYMEERILEVVDEKLKGEFKDHEVLMVLKLGLMCSREEQLERPSMRQVVSYLEGEVEIPHLRLHGTFPNVGVPEFYVRRSASFSTLPDSLVRSMYEPR